MQITSLILLTLASVVGYIAYKESARSARRGSRHLIEQPVAYYDAFSEEPRSRIPGNPQS